MQSWSRKTVKNQVFLIKFFGSADLCCIFGVWKLQKKITENLRPAVFWYLYSTTRTGLAKFCMEKLSDLRAANWSKLSRCAPISAQLQCFLYPTVPISYGFNTGKYPNFARQNFFGEMKALRAFARKAKNVNKIFEKIIQIEKHKGKIVQIECFGMK